MIVEWWKGRMVGLRLFCLSIVGGGILCATARQSKTNLPTGTIKYIVSYCIVSYVRRVECSEGRTVGH